VFILRTALSMSSFFSLDCPVILAVSKWKRACWWETLPSSIPIHGFASDVTPLTVHGMHRR